MLSTNPKQETSIGDLSGIYNMLFLIFLSWFALGTMLDSWAHFNLSDDLETFFTPWHGVLYSGGAATSLLIMSSYLVNAMKGKGVLNSIPKGYEFAFLGVFVFSLSGISDMIWHILFGIETDIEAMFSPTHLIGLVAGVLIFSTPIRIALLKNKNTTLSWLEYIPVVLSMLYCSVLISLFSVPFQPFYMTWAAIDATGTATFTSQTQTHGVRYLIQAVGMAGIIFFGMFMAAILLFLTTRFRLPKGGLFVYLICFLSIQAIINQHFVLIPGIIISAILVELLYRYIRTVNDKYRNMIFAFCSAIAIFLPYFTIMYTIYNSSWIIHLAAGAPFLGSIFATLQSFSFHTPILAD